MTKNCIVFLILFSGVQSNAHPVEDLQPLTWYQAPNSALKNSDVVYSEYSLGSLTTIMQAWSGGAFNSRDNQLLIWGGGLGNYKGNEIYAFDVDDLKWKRLSDPYHVSNNTCMEPFPNQTPMTRHTYSQLVYLEDSHKFLVYGGAKNCKGSVNLTKTWTFDLSTLRWVDNGTYGSHPNGVYGASSAYYLGKAYYSSNYRGSRGLYSYDSSNNQWEKLNDIDNLPDVTSAVDTKRGLYVVIGKGTGYYYDLKNKNYSRKQLGFTVSEGAVGFDYDIENDKFVFWKGGSNIYVFDMVTKKVQSIQLMGNPGNRLNEGTYGRFRYVPKYKAFILTNGVDKNVSFFKLADVQIDTVSPRAPLGLEIN